MPRLIAFLRAINVGGHVVTMDRLKGLFQELKLNDVETFIASGNVIFSSNAKDFSALELKIEKHLHKALGYEVRTFLRTAAEVNAIARYQPFPPERIVPEGKLHIGFLAERLRTEARKALLDLRTDTDDFHTQDREIYWYRTGNLSESKITGNILEKALRASTTLRNANTVNRLAAKYKS